MMTTTFDRQALHQSAHHYICDASLKVWRALEGALSGLAAAEIVDLARWLLGFGGLPSDVQSPPGRERETVDQRRGALLGLLTRRLASSRSPEVDALFVDLIDARPEALSASALDAILGLPPHEAKASAPPPKPASEAVLGHLAGHLVAGDPLRGHAVIAASLLGERDAVARLAAFDETGAALRLLLAYAWQEPFAALIDEALVTLVVRHWATHAALFGCVLQDRAPAGALLDTLARAPDERLDEELLKGLRRALDPETAARLGTWLASAAPRAVTKRLAKLASERASASREGPRRAALTSRGVVATDGGPVLLGLDAALAMWPGAPRSEGDAASGWREACAALGPVTPIAVPGGPVFALKSHAPIVEVFDAGRGVTLLLLWGDPDTLAETHAALEWQDTGLRLPPGRPALLDAAWTVAASRADSDRHVALTARRKESVIFIASGRELGALRLAT